LFNNELLCSCVNYYVDTNNNKKTSRFINKINMSLDKYFKRKYLKDEKSFKVSSYVTQSTSKKSYIKKLYNICY
jgi:2-methylcitrate dehydratase PrpD